jgi:hypothetical protein
MVAFSGKINAVEIKVKGLYLKNKWYYYGRMRNGIRGSAVMAQPRRRQLQTSARRAV